MIYVINDTHVAVMEYVNGMSGGVSVYIRWWLDLSISGAQSEEPTYGLTERTIQTSEYLAILLWL